MTESGRIHSLEMSSWKNFTRWARFGIDHHDQRAIFHGWNWNPTLFFYAEVSVEFIEDRIVDPLAFGFNIYFECKAIIYRGCSSHISIEERKTQHVQNRRTLTIVGSMFNVIYPSKPCPRRLWTRSPWMVWHRLKVHCIVEVVSRSRNQAKLDLASKIERSISFSILFRSKN